MNQRNFTSALLLGMTAGLRSMMAPAALALAQQRPGNNRIWLLSSPKTARALTMLALGELIFDKLPFAPRRISPGVLSGRLLSGAMCGAAVVPKDQSAGALLGIMGAAVGSFAGYAIRKGVVRVSGVPDPIVAVAEDMLAIGVGMVASAESQSWQGASEFQETGVRVA